MGKKSKPAFLRILLKLSGESLLGKEKFGMDPDAICAVTKAVSGLVELGVEVGIVIGGGNLFRGQALAKTGLDRVTSDQMGMLATVMNGLLLRDSFVKEKVPAELMSSISMYGVVEGYDRRKAVSYLESGRVVIFVGGTGCPFFSTDSAASLRSIEIGADILLKATKVDGVYSDDPLINPKAKRFTRLSYQDVLEKQLKVMDATAISLCKENDMPVRIFDMNKVGILKEIVLGADEGTLISN